MFFLCVSVCVGACVGVRLGGWVGGCVVVGVQLGKCVGVSVWVVDVCICFWCTGVMLGVSYMLTITSLLGRHQC